MTTPFGPNAPLDLSALINEVQKSTQVLTQIHNDLKNGVALAQNLQNFTVAGLPLTGNGTGRVAFATNARKPGEGAGVGTGMIVVWNPATTTWFTTLGVVVTS